MYFRHSTKHTLLWLAADLLALEQAQRGGVM